MPAEQPGRRYSVVATKTHVHGLPAVELNHAGIAAKTTNPLPMAPSVANATLAQAIAIDEEFVVMLDGVHDVDSDSLPAGAAAGDPIYIKKADDTLVDAAEALTAGILEAAYAKFGLLDEIDSALGIAYINLTQRSAF